MKPNNRIKDLLAADVTPAEVIQKAIAQEQEEEEARQIQAVKRSFSAARETLNFAVNNLRKIRETEKQAKKYVLKVDKAFRKFQEDADYNSFVDAVNS